MIAPGGFSDTQTEEPQAPDPQAWVGRTETREGAVTGTLAGMLGATLSHPGFVLPDLSPGAPLPPLWHWVAFPEFVPMAGLGRDGHPALGRFLPPLPFGRRMWAGGRLEWRGTLRLGEVLQRRSEILAITEKDGSTGPMVLVRVGHDLSGREGAIREEQEIVYLDIPDRFRAPRAIPAPETASFRETVQLGEARLFRYSAATFNAHRIHYDLPYAREIEKYPALVVHGPMQATLLIEAACRHAGRLPRRFRFKGVHPMFHDQDMALIGVADPGGAAIDLCTAASASGHQCMQARMEWDA